MDRLGEKMNKKSLDGIKALEKQLQNILIDVEDYEYFFDSNPRAIEILQRLSELSHQYYTICYSLLEEINQELSGEEEEND